MKKIIIACSILLASALVSCGGGTPKNKVSTSDAQSAAMANGQLLTVDTEQSSLYWKGTKVGGMHDGTIAISNGSLTLSGEQQVTAGSFTIDMDAITNFDLKEDAKMQAMLLNHLKSVDFFEVKTYPTSTFTITKIEAAQEADSVTHYVSGNLKMKDVEKNITFGANITKNEAENAVKYVAETVPFSIDRTEWNVKHGSKKLFPKLKDGIVNDNIELKIKIVANASPVL